MGDLGKIASQVAARAEELVHDPQQDIDSEFVKACLDQNDRGNGIMYARLYRDRYLKNVTPRDEEWYRWAGHVWEYDHYMARQDAVERCAEIYEAEADRLDVEIENDGIDKNHKDAWKIALAKKYRRRVDRLRTEAGARACYNWAAVVDTSMACREDEFNQRPMLLPCANGVIDLETGALVDGRPEDLMTKAIDVEYDPHADYSLWESVLRDITDSAEEIPSFLKRSFGYAATGYAYEQYIWVFLGPGRNGKGIIFNLISEVLGPFFHTINPAMLLEQRNPPSPSAASEHLYSLLGKRLIVGSETNKGKRIDGAAIKELTGEDEINCRPNFSSEINFYPTHTLMLRTNNVPVGMTQDFALRERLLLLDFPYRYVDDVEEHKRKSPMFADFFRQKDKHLKDKLRQIKPGILRWIVEGCLEWQQRGLDPPGSVLAAVDKLSAEEDYVGRFVEDCLVAVPDDIEGTRLACKEMYRVFRWWWSENEGIHEKRIPAMKTINRSLREKGFIVGKKGGVTYIFGCRIEYEISLKVDEFGGQG